MILFLPYIMLANFRRRQVNPKRPYYKKYIGQIASYRDASQLQTVLPRLYNLLPLRHFYIIDGIYISMQNESTHIAATLHASMEMISGQKIKGRRPERIISLVLGRLIVWRYISTIYIYTHTHTKGRACVHPTHQLCFYFASHKLKNDRARCLRRRRRWLRAGPSLSLRLCCVHTRGSASSSHPEPFLLASHLLYTVYISVF